MYLELYFSRILFYSITLKCKQYLTAWALNSLCDKFHAVVATVKEFFSQPTLIDGLRLCQALDLGPGIKIWYLTHEAYSIVKKPIFRRNVFLILYLLINLFCIVSSRAWWASSACKACEHSLASMVRTRCSPHPRKWRKPKTVEEKQ